MFETNPPSVRTALRVLLIVLVVVFGVIIYTYGWHKTDISLDEVQDPSRTSSVQRALSELFAPNIFDRDLTIHDTKFDVPFGCPDGANPTDRLELPSDHSGSEPYISMPGLCRTGSSNRGRGAQLPQGRVCRNAACARRRSEYPL